ncbi:MAG TPA: ATP-binding protein, partial [Polyangiaceae bacterium]|nr:ATP-binding protein [Polyangiaceae bacterium]
VLPDVLAHLVRNSLAHGIETVEDRAAAGKDELSVIRVAALEGPEGPSISVEDDGRGFDSGRILGRARALGLAESDVGFLVCVSGLSTAERSDLAGHGVGLAAVRSDLESVGYSMSLHSSENGLRIDMSPHEARPRTASSL